MRRSLGIRTPRQFPPTLGWVAVGALLAVGLVALLVFGIIGVWAWGDARPGEALTPSSVAASSAERPSSVRATAATVSPQRSPTATEDSAPELPTTLQNGPWPTSHVQGIAVDQAKGFVYYSFTTLLVKTDTAGQVLGTVDGFTGHLGDLEFNPADGRVYGSLEYKDARAFYIAIFDVDRIDRVGMSAQNSAVVSTVYLREVVDDFTADLDGNGVFDGDTPDTNDHRYGCSGIDGVAFGPRFGSATGQKYLTVAYGIYENVYRDDNDHQVLLQYDIGDWAQYEQPLLERQPHRAGPSEVAGKYFVYTGNTDFGVQSLAYDQTLERWLISVYPGSKPGFPNYGLYAVDAAAQPELKPLQGLAGERGQLIPLADDGLNDERSGIRGWRRSLPFGIQPLGEGRFYLVDGLGSKGRSSAKVTLETWTGAAGNPFEPVGG